METKRDLEKYGIVNTERIKEMKDQLKIYRAQNETFIKAKREGQNQEDKMLEAMTIQADIDAMKIKLKKMKIKINYHKRIWEEKGRHQVKWKTFIACIMTKVYGKSNDPTKVINLMDMSEKLQEHIQKVKKDVSEEQFQNWCNGDDAMYITTLMEIDISPVSEGNLLFQGDSINLENQLAMETSQD